MVHKHYICKSHILPDILTQTLSLNSYFKTFLNDFLNAINPRKGGDIGLFIKLVPKNLIISYSLPYNFGDF